MYVFVYVFYVMCESNSYCFPSDCSSSGGGYSVVEFIILGVVVGVVLLVVIAAVLN